MARLSNHTRVKKNRPILSENGYTGDISLPDHETFVPVNLVPPHAEVLVVSAEGELELECRPSLRWYLDPDPPAVRFHDPSHDEQTEAGAFRCLALALRVTFE
jgi:hypothetical protein